MKFSEHLKDCVGYYYRVRVQKFYIFKIVAGGCDFNTWIHKCVRYIFIP